MLVYQRCLYHQPRKEPWLRISSRLPGQRQCALLFHFAVREWVCSGDPLPCGRLESLHLESPTLCLCPCYVFCSNHHCGTSALEAWCPSSRSPQDTLSKGTYQWQGVVQEGPNLSQNETSCQPSRRAEVSPAIPLPEIYPREIKTDPLRPVWDVSAALFI